MNAYKFVYFHEYCDKCKYKDVAEDEVPCTECLEHPVMPYSHKPAYFVPSIGETTSTKKG